MGHPVFQNRHDEPNQNQYTQWDGDPARHNGVSEHHLKEELSVAVNVQFKMKAGSIIRQWFKRKCVSLDLNELRTKRADLMRRISWMKTQQWDVIQRGKAKDLQQEVEWKLQDLDLWIQDWEIDERRSEMGQQPFFVPARKTEIYKT